MDSSGAQNAKRLFRLVGGVLIFVGAVLPWLQVKPNQFSYPAVYIPGMDTGTEVGGLIFLPIVFLAIVATLRYPYGRKTDLLTVVAGGVVVYITGEYIVTYSSYFNQSGLMADNFEPTLGVHLTLIGGAALLIEAAIALSIDGLNRTSDGGFIASRMG